MAVARRPPPSPDSSTFPTGSTSHRCMDVTPLLCICAVALQANRALDVVLAPNVTALNGYNQGECTARCSLPLWRGLSPCTWLVFIAWHDLAPVRDRPAVQIHPSSASRARSDSTRRRDARTATSVQARELCSQIFGLSVHSSKGSGKPHRNFLFEKLWHILHSRLPLVMNKKYNIAHLFFVFCRRFLC